MNLTSNRRKNGINLNILCFSVLLLLLLQIPTLECQLSAISIDFGSHFYKVGLIKPGVPMEISLNKESQRKTSNVVAILGEETYFGDQAASQRRRKPVASYAFLVNLLGKKLDNPVVQNYQKHFPFYHLIADPNRGTVLFEEKSSGNTYSPEELVAMILADARAAAEAYAEQKIKDVVIAVPAYFTQAERRAMANAVDIAGLNLLSLINDNTAGKTLNCLIILVNFILILAGLNYGMFRRKEFTKNATTVLIYDMGAWKTTATIFQYAIVEDKLKKEAEPQMTVLGFGFNRHFGGLLWTMRLRDHLAKTFMTLHKPKTAITENHKAMVKLFDEAERVKKILSANMETIAQVESLHEDMDFRTQVTREQFENLCKDLFDQVQTPIQQALNAAEITLEDIDHIIIMGGSTRIPKLQERLQVAVKGKELGKYLNADEAVAMGAVYFAAHKTKGFKVKKFIIRECNLYPVEVHFASERMDQLDTAVERRIIRRVLYGLKNFYPQKKMITFSKHTHDFELMLNYGDLKHLTNDQIESIGSLNITRVDLLNVTAVVANNSEEETSKFKGIRVHFSMDEGGILHIIEAEATFEKTVLPETEEQSTLSKIGKKISDFFASSKDGATNDTVAHDDADKNETTSSTFSSSNGTDFGASSDNSTETVKRDSVPDVKKPKVTTVRVNIPLQLSAVDIPDIPVEEMERFKAKLKAYALYKEKKELREKASNDLESFIFETRHKLDQADYLHLSTEEEREHIRAQLIIAETWLEDQGPQTLLEEFKEQLKFIRNVTEALFFRHNEFTRRPQAIAILKEVANFSKTFLEHSEKMKEQNALTEVELKTLSNMLNETMEWFENVEAQQNQTAPHLSPVFTVENVLEKAGNLDREVRYLLNKLKIHRPVTTQAPDAGSQSTNDTETQSASSTTNTTSEMPATDESSSTPLDTAMNETEDKPDKKHAEL
ncbi:Hypoxia up-regulated protein 1 [Trichinella pseudospiralis]|uniref:Hypoxia up-regulated protein 1 n=1 Tax=Trichinella pseudospiralis TaxID=6337 RepID=A0A0V1HNI4_TRIPS|nr:Hypoxia up-regulated protein 1 [Trichinella pseudospiralis]